MRCFRPLVFIQTIALHLRHGRVGVRSSQAQKDQHSGVRRMVGLPHMLVGDFPANFPRLLPSGAGLISVNLKRSLDFGDALGSGLRLHDFCILRVGGRWRPGEKGNSEQRNQAVPKDHVAPGPCSSFAESAGLAALKSKNARRAGQSARTLGSAAYDRTESSSRESCVREIRQAVREMRQTEKQNYRLAAWIRASANPRSLAAPPGWRISSTENP